MRIRRFTTSAAGALAAAALAPVLAPAAAADGLAGPYLAARHAERQSDFRAAADYYSRAMNADPGAPELADSSVLALIGLGEFERAASLSRGAGQVGSLVRIADGFRRGAYGDVLADLEAGASVSALVDGLLEAWAHAGAGSMTAAVAGFDEVAGEAGAVAHYHKALALALVGDHEGAAAILSGDAHGPLQLPPRGIAAYAQILSRLERGADAAELVEGALGADPDPALLRLRDRLAAGAPVAFDAVSNATDGAAEVLLAVAGALRGESNDGHALLYSRAAEFLRPDDSAPILVSAALLESLGRHGLAIEAYARIPPGDAAFAAAERGRAEALRGAGRPEAAIEALRSLAAAMPGDAGAHRSLGDMLREEGRHEEASAAYDASIALLGAPRPEHWRLYFTRGISFERTGRWPLAEADFRTALELKPGQPQVQNYLGYSLVEMGAKLDEALRLIEEAVAAEPESGYIVDSLGWAQFRLGRYASAVANLERAAELTATDPIITDHLGDAYWAVGRRTEARFQWRRALSFDPEEEDAARIRRKLDVGLDDVLAEEGAPPLSAAAGAARGG